MYPKKIPMYSEPFFGEQDEFKNSGKDITNISIHKNCNVGMHSHDFYEINIVLSGKGCHYIGEISIPLVSGEVFVIPPNVLHGYYREKELDVCHITLKNEFFERYREDLQSIPGYSTLFEIEPYLRQVYDKNLFLHFNKEKLLRVDKEVRKIMQTQELGSEYAHYRTILVLKFISDMCYHISLGIGSEEIENADNYDILYVLEYIQNHLDTNIQIEQLMQMANMSRTTFHRRFKKMVKMTPLQYILECRITLAQSLLAKGEMSKTEIAQKCGFFDTSHMNKYLNK